MNIIEAAGLTKSFGAVTALDGLDLTATAGRVCALLGPERRGQDHRHPDPGHADPPGRGPGQRRRARRRPPARPGPGRHRAGRAARGRRRRPHRPGEPGHPRAHASPGPAPGPAAGGRPAGRVRPGRRRLPAGQDLVRRHAATARRGGSLILSPRCCSWTSRPPGLDPRSRSEIWATVRGLAREWHHGAAVDPVPERGRRAGRRRRDHRHRAGGRPGHARTSSRTPSAPAWTSCWPTPATWPPRPACWGAGPPVRPSPTPTGAALSAPVGAGAITLPELVRQLEAAGLRAEDVSVRRPTLDEVFLARTAEAGAAA